MNNLLGAFAPLFLLLTALSALLSCDSGSTGKTAVESFHFVESSSGLPVKGQWRQAISFYDMNRDGHLDILAPPPRKAPKEDQRPFIWLGNGKGEWSSFTPDVPINIPYDYGGIAGGDFNNDDMPDMVLAIHSEALAGLKGLKDGRYGNFSKGLPPKEAFASRALASADFNNDGITDIAAVSEGLFTRESIGAESGAMVCLGGSAQWQCRFVGDKEQTRGLFADKIVTGDVNGDGNMDIGIASLQHKLDLIVWIGDGKGGFTPFNGGLMMERHYTSVAFADLNGDGRDDLIAGITGFSNQSNKRLLKAYLAENDGFKDASEGLPDNEAYYAVSAGDLDGDGVPEIVGGTGNGLINVFTQKNGRWKQVKTFGLPEGGLWRLCNTYCVDVNRDGFDDIALNYATEENNTGAIRVFLNVPRQKK